MDTNNKLIPLPLQIKEKWVAALRSGNYTQAKGFLKTGDGYCCLGVLAEVCGPPGLIEMEEGSLWSCFAALPHEYQKAIHPNLGRVLSQQRRLGDAPVDAQLMHMNDSHDKSFAEIADWIDENL